GLSHAVQLPGPPPQSRRGAVSAPRRRPAGVARPAGGGPRPPGHSPGVRGVGPRRAGRGHPPRAALGCRRPPRRRRCAGGGREWAASDFGLEPCDRSKLSVATPEESARVVRAILEGQEGPAARVVTANAAAALLVAGKAAGLSEGVRLAGAAIKSGAAGRVLE